MLPCPVSRSHHHTQRSTVSGQASSSVCVAAFAPPLHSPRPVATRSVACCSPHGAFVPQLAPLPPRPFARCPLALVLIAVRSWCIPVHSVHRDAVRSAMSGGGARYGQNPWALYRFAPPDNTVVGTLPWLLANTLVRGARSWLTVVPHGLPWLPKHPCCAFTCVPGVDNACNRLAAGCCVSTCVCPANVPTHCTHPLPLSWCRVACAPVPRPCSTNNKHPVQRRPLHGAFDVVFGTCAHSKRFSVRWCCVCVLGGGGGGGQNIVGLWGPEGLPYPPYPPPPTQFKYRSTVSHALLNSWLNPHHHLHACTCTDH